MTFSPLDRNFFMTCLQLVFDLFMMNKDYVLWYLIDYICIKFRNFFFQRSSIFSTNCPHIFFKLLLTSPPGLEVLLLVAGAAILVALVGAAAVGRLLLRLGEEGGRVGQLDAALADQGHGVGVGAQLVTFWPEKYNP